MKVAIGADPLGFELKEKVKAHLLAEGYEMLDLGTLAADEPVKYIEVSDRVAVSVQTKESEFGIVFLRPCPCRRWRCPRWECRR